MLFFFALVYLFYYRRFGQEILTRYSENKWNQTKNILLVLLVLVLPLIISIKLTTIAIERFSD